MGAVIAAIAVGFAVLAAVYGLVVLFELANKPERVPLARQLAEERIAERERQTGRDRASWSAAEWRSLTH